MAETQTAVEVLRVLVGVVVVLQLLGKPLPEYVLAV
jgi:hypothetical protein